MREGGETVLSLKLTMLSVSVKFWMVLSKKVMKQAVLLEALQVLVTVNCEGAVWVVVWEKERDARCECCVSFSFCFVLFVVFVRKERERKKVGVVIQRRAKVEKGGGGGEKEKKKRMEHKSPKRLE